LAALNQSIWSNFLSHTWNKHLNICLWQPYSPFWRSKLNGTEFILLHTIKGETFLWKLNLSLRHLTATSSLEWQNIQIFLFRSLFFRVSFSNIQDFTLPTREHCRSCLESSRPCFHSKWCEQQHNASNGMKAPLLGPIFTTYIHSLQFRNTIYNNLFVLSSIIENISPWILALKMSTACSNSTPRPFRSFLCRNTRIRFLSKFA